VTHGSVPPSHEIGAGGGGPVPEDDEARSAIASDLDSTVFAVAGAGSGKTRHLVDRVVHILSSGAATIGELAAITFTEAAAAELRDRIAEELDAVAAAGVDEPQARRAVDALDGLDSAAITTLHGFARRVLAEHPFEVGLPPAFEVLDEVRSMAELEEQWGAIVDAVLGDPEAARALQWAVACGASLDGLRRIARQLAADWDLVSDCAAPSPLPALDARPVRDPVRAALAMAARCNDPTDKLVAHLATLTLFASRLDDAQDDELELLRLLVRHPRTLSAGNKGRAANWNGDKPEVRRLLEEAETARQGLVRGAVGAALDALCAALGRMVLAAAQRRRSEGRLEYHDLLVLARDLVRDHPAVRSALHTQYRYLLVDEFQDTDPLQAELMVLIAAPEGAPVGSVGWEDLPTVPGQLFFVGDPQQSIYRFRRADVEVFTRARERVATRTVELVTNFRSVPGIVQWVDEVFSSLLGGEGVPGQPAYARAVAARPPAAGDRAATCSVTVLGAGCARAERATEARRQEAEDLAATLAEAIAVGWGVGDDQRPVRPSDIAVLIPTRTSLPSLEQALDASGLSYRLRSSSLVYGAAEVQDVLSVLHAVDDPVDEASVVTALRTPGYGCGDDDLVRFRRAGGRWDYRAAVPAVVPSDDPVRQGLGSLRALHAARAWTDVPDLVARVVEERRYFAAAFDGGHWREEWRRLRFVADQARRFAEGSAGGLREYLAWVEVQRSEDARVTEVVMPESDVEAVSIMTVHAAKGLEFPVVAVVGLGAAPHGVKAPRVLFGPRGPEAAIAAALCTAGYDALRDREQTLEEHERLRLLYVAVTRARDHLVVSLHRTAHAETSTSARLEAALPDPSLGLWRAAAPAGGPGAGGGGGPGGGAGVRGARGVGTGGDAVSTPAGTTDTAADLERWSAERARRLLQPPVVVSATGVATLARAREAARTETAGASAGHHDPGAGPVPGGVEEPDVGDGTGHVTGAAANPWRRGRAGTAVGRAVHAVLQMVDLATGEGLDVLAATQASVEGVPDRAAHVAALARAALASDVVQAAVAGRYWRELYVGVPVGGRVLEGFVDLLFEGEDGLEVVDYKTDTVTSDADIDRLVGHYRLQGAAYARAVTAVVGRPVRRCSFLFLRGGSAVIRALTDLDAAMADVDGVLGADGSGGPAPSP
jgi:ATP-dependent helicase/nuclease subunit A